MDEAGTAERSGSGETLFRQPGGGSLDAPRPSKGWRSSFASANDVLSYIRLPPSAGRATERDGGGDDEEGSSSSRLPLTDAGFGAIPR